MDPLDELAAQQHGLLTDRQLRTLGVGYEAVRNRDRRRRLERLTSRVHRMIGSPDTPPQRLWAAVLDAGEGAAVGLHSAAAHWEIASVPLLPPHVIVQRPRGGQPHQGPLGTVHYTRVLPDEHIALAAGLRITTPARTIFDLAAHLHPDRLERVVDKAWSKRLITGRQLRLYLEQLRGRGRSGISAMRAIIDVRGDDYRPPDSNLESRFEQIMRDNGIYSLRRQVDLGDDRDWIARVDYEDTVDPLVVFIQSAAHHASIVDRRKDREQIEALEALGVVVLEIWDDEVWTDPGTVAHKVWERKAEARTRTR